MLQLCNGEKLLSFLYQTTIDPEFIFLQEVEQLFFFLNETAKQSATLTLIRNKPL